MQANGHSRSFTRSPEYGMRAHLHLILAFALVCPLCGCKKFASQRRADFAPFAEQTIAGISQLDANLGRRRPVLTVRYVDEQLDNIEENIRPLIERLELLQVQMVEYSIVVGRLAMAGKKEEAQVAELVEFMEKLHLEVEIHVAGDDYFLPEELDEIVANVRAQEKILDALTEAQPLIGTFALIAARTARELRAHLSELEEVIGARMKEDFAGIPGFASDYLGERDRLLGALKEIYRHRSGDAEALPRLISSGVVPEAHLATLDLSDPLGDVALEEQLLARFGRLKQVADALWPELDQYQALQQGLDEMITSFEAEVRAVWAVVFVWTRAHQRMASGVVDPAEWFDVGEAPSALFGVAKRSSF